jgi:hypothetical protein
VAVQWRTSQTITTPIKAETTPGNSQPANRRLERGSHGAFGANRERGQKNTLDCQDEAKRGEKVGHEREAPIRFGVVG